MNALTKHKIDVVIGTRPEAIKMAPVVLELRRRAGFSVRIIATGQHSDMLDQALDYFSLRAEVNLRIMKSRQSLDHITSSVMCGTGSIFDETRPDAVLVHGDTTTTLASAMAAYYRGIPTGHVEAGLRSFNMQRPFPEEMNRVVTDRLATWWFAPTELAAGNLEREGAARERIFVTGNTVVDALHTAVAQNRPPDMPCMEPLTDGAPFLLLTAHRRESWGVPLEHICAALLRILDAHGAYRALVPMHRNPAVRETITRILGGDERVILCDPLDYPDFVWAVNRCTLALSDSGGVQEEATALQKPVLILRDVTERPEAVESGSCLLVGTDEARIVSNAHRLLSDKSEYEALRKRAEKNPFGDGRASVRIADILHGALSAV